MRKNMSKKWSKKEIDGLVDLLEELSDRYSTDGCNDLSKKQQKLADVLNVGLDQDNEEDSDYYINANYGLVSYFQEKLKIAGFDQKEPENETLLKEKAALEQKISFLEKELKKQKEENEELQMVKEMISVIKKL